MTIWSILAFFALLAWAVVGTLSVRKAHQIIHKEMKFLFEPDVNLYARNKAGARYDQAALSPLKVYLGAFFIFPIRIPLLILIWIQIASQMIVMNILYGSKNL